jgi:DNA-binding transcriptional LysR family regulator
MNSRQLKYFVSVADHLNFTAAAKSLYIAQSTLSQQIADLEGEVGVKLFIRNSHEVRLTIAGIAFLKEAKFLIARIEEAVRLARQAEYGVAGSVKIGFVPGLERRILPELVASLRHKYPNITLTLNNVEMKTLDRSLRQGDMGIGITIVPHRQTIPGLTSTLLYTDVLCLVISHDHPLAGKTEVNFSAIDQTFIFSDPGSRAMDHMLQICSERKVSPKIILAPTLEEIFLLIGGGAGVSILPHTVSEAYCGPNVQYIDLNYDDCHIDVVAAWKNGNDNPCIPIVLKELELISESVSLLGNKSETGE